MKIKSILFTLFVLMITLSMNTIAYAKENEEMIISEEQAVWLRENILNVDQASGNVKGAGAEGWIEKFLTANANDAATDENGPIQVGTWDKGESSGEIYLRKGKTLKELSHRINQSKDNDAVETLLEVTNGLQLTTDTQAATTILLGFMPIFSMFIGIIVVLITIGMTMFSAFDIAYIAFPVFRNKCEDIKQQGGRGTRTTANGETKLRWVTDDAQYAVQQGSIESDQNPWVIYFRKRIWSYVMLAVILFILMTGNISLITNIALNIVSGIMDVLTSLAV